MKRTLSELDADMMRLCNGQNESLVDSSLADGCTVLAEMVDALNLANLPYVASCVGEMHRHWEAMLKARRDHAAGRFVTTTQILDELKGLS